MKLRAGTPAEAGMSAERIERLKTLAAGWVAEGVHPALCVLVARKGVIVLHEAFGRLRPDPASPLLAKDSIFPLSSMTKPITATLAMVLVEDGLLGLSRPVQEYLPEFEGDGKDSILVTLVWTGSPYVVPSATPVARARPTKPRPPDTPRLRPRFPTMVFGGHSSALAMPSSLAATQSAAGSDEASRRDP